MNKEILYDSAWKEVKNVTKFLILWKIGLECFLFYLQFFGENCTVFGKINCAHVLVF